MIYVENRDGKDLLVVEVYLKVKIKIYKKRKIRFIIVIWILLFRRIREKFKFFL
ncbi:MULTISPECIES: hypothetical protein [unclassified Thermosipho (in: thermotogales)]|uniref:hypothetical protein n=1 Tax=unclassified Thermosipho (in: thermotogales) TaxID=2676525 RepID=UPI00094938F4|nr:MULTISPECIES: hypothetical protein [unclassified Thermosipho (in: thermotogales)]ANQ54604.1 hypothetical protein Y592_04145 [Thermosipho sp. 1070]